MSEEARDVSPFYLNKKRESTAPPDSKKKPVADDDVRTVVPVMFTKPGEDFYTSDDPGASPIYSDFRAAIFPADTEVPMPGDDQEVDDEELTADPKDSSVPESVDSSTPSPAEPPVQIVQVGESNNPLTEAIKSLDAVKDSGQPKENESSSQTSSSTSETKPGSPEQPASD